MIKKIALYLLKALILILLISLVISFYQYLSHLIIDGSNHLINSNNIFTVVLAITVGILVLFISFYVNNKYNNKYYNNCIDLLEEYYLDEIEIKPIEAIIFLFANSLIGFYGGFLLGGEAPSVSLGGNLGILINKIFKEDDKDITKICASAGFACAFLTPISGVAHLLDEHKNSLSLSLFLKAIPIIVLSALLSSLIFKHGLININVNTDLIWYGYFLLIPLTIITYLLSRIFRFLNKEIKKTFSNKYFLMIFTVVLFITFMLLKRFNPIMASSGSIIFNIELDYVFYVSIALLLWRIIGTVFSNNAYVGGGLVVPALALGALIGFSYINVILLINFEFVAYKNIFIVCGMFLFFGFISGNYLTSIALLGEMLLAKAMLPYTICIVVASILLFFEHLVLRHKATKDLSISTVV